MTPYLRFEIVCQYRRLDALLWRLLLPAALYPLFRLTSSSAPEATFQGLPSDVSSMVIFAVLATLLSGVFATAPALAAERASGWLAQLRAMPLPATTTVAAKVAAALAFALPAIALVMLAAAISEGVTLGFGRWIELTLLLWVATAPFAALGVLIGLLTPSPVVAQSAAAGAIAVLWVLGGMVTEPSDLPGALETTAGLLPTNAAAELGWAAARAEAVPGSALAVVAGWTAGLGTLGALAWRKLGTR
ncbi:MAG: hypothetical protein GEU88_17330 [Solirubrobacterales bacterium]|nr:hypothetical protein [Solirubrobacterales bacterium]